MRGELGRERLVQAHEQRAGDAARGRDDRHRETAQRDRTAVEKDELGEMCVALWLHRGIVSSVDVANQKNHATQDSRRHVQHPARW